MPIYVVMLGAAGVAAAACSADNESSGYGDPEMDSAEFPLNGGQWGPQKPALGSIPRAVDGAGGSPGTGGTSGAGATPAEDFRCSATLVHPQWVVTAASCFGYQTGAVNERWAPGPGTGSGGAQITYVQSVGTTNDAKNIAFGRLSTPSLVPPVSIATAMPTQGQTVTASGYGCIGAGNPIGGSRYVEFPFGQTTNLACSKGDEGGPRFSGTASATPTLLWGLTGQIDGSGVDKVADLVQFGLPYQRGLTAFGGTILATSPINPPTFESAAFLAASRNPNVRPVAGDFNGDGMGDVALFGGGDYPDRIHIAFGGVRGFQYFADLGHPNFGNWAVVAKSIVAGDFDGDGDSDIALVGGPGWTTVPVAYFDRFSFTVQNEPGEQFAIWAAEPGAYAVAADLSGDGVTDLALVGGAGWTTVPIQKRKPGGVREIINPGVSAFPSYSRAAGVRAYAARLAVNSSADSLILIGHSLVATSVRLSADGSALSLGLSLFPSDVNNTWAKAPGVKVIVADFNGDALSDFAFIGPITNPPPKYLPFVVSAGTSLNKAFLPIADFPAWGQNARFALPFRRSSLLTVSDLVLLDVAGGPQNVFPYAELRP